MARRRSCAWLSKLYASVQENLYSSTEEVAKEMEGSSIQSFEASSESWYKFSSAEADRMKHNNGA